MAISALDGAAAAPIGILGGTFDPIHFGHLRPALELREALALAQVRLVPSAQPPHRQRPSVTPADRCAMVERAIDGLKGFLLDDRELQRSGPSYSVDTLRSLRQEVGERPLCWLLGEDALLGLTNWSRWRELFELAHLVVMQRPGVEVDLSAMEPTLADELRARRAAPAALAAGLAGRVIFQPVTQLAISATQIRELLAAGRSPRFLLPDSVLDYIYQQKLYGAAAAVSPEEKDHY